MTTIDDNTHDGNKHEVDKCHCYNDNSDVHDDGDCADGDGEELLEEVGDEMMEESAFLSNLLESLTPTTHSQSMVLFKSRITLDLIGYNPEASPSWIV